MLSDAELLMFWSAFGEIGARGLALKTLLLTGQRPGEVLHMRREHVKEGWWEMRGAPDPKTGWPGTKNGATHRIWLPEAVIKSFPRGTFDGTGFVFTFRDGIARSMREICARLKVERATPHDLRRTHGTTITRLGFGREALNRIQNHKEGGIADVYDVHKYSEENRRIMEAVASHVVAIAEGKSPPANVVRMRGAGH